LADAFHSFPATKTMGEIKKVTTCERSASQICRITKGLYGAESKEPRQRFLADALGSFPAANYTEVKKVTNSERTRISYYTALTSATYVVLPKENHMQLTEAATLDRKSGKAEGSAVPRTSP
jgi:hypothetical protein